jgi:hypothetical protein
MPQISLYIDEETLKKARRAAEQRNLSISRWVAEQIRSRVEAEYPAGFDDLFGSISDETSTEPSELPRSADTPRDSV